MAKEEELLDADACPAQGAWDVVSGKWKPCIIYVLHHFGTLRFNALKRHVPGITQRMLTRQLRELEKDGMTSRQVFNEVPTRVEYELTELGHSVIPIFDSLSDWWDQNQPVIQAARKRFVPR